MQNQSLYMYLKRLILTNYKNIETADITFSDGINCIVGLNGAGKTNMLSAIYYLSACKDYFNMQESLNILTNYNYFIIDGYFFDTQDNEIRVQCSVQRDKAKNVKFNGKDYQRLSDHIGKIPLVMLSPSDTVIIYEGSEERRKLLSYMISQFDKTYLNNLIQYNKALENKNKALKIMQENRQTDQITLDMYNLHLVKCGNIIHDIRKNFMEDFVGIFQKYYAIISQNNETVELKYKSQLFDGDFALQLTASKNAELAAGFTLTGIHKDDLEFTIDRRSLKKTASQGQQKTFIIAIKLAYYEYISKKTNIKPLLLLDDIFDKLDKERVSKIIELVSSECFGQIFMSDTNKNHLENILENVATEYKVFSVNNGKIKN